VFVRCLPGLSSFIESNYDDRGSRLGIITMQYIVIP